MGLHLPRQVWGGTTVLAFAAGMVNAAGYLGFEHQALSHLTGTASLGALAFGAGHWSVAAQLAGVIASFVGGGFLAGLVLNGRTLSWRYVGLFAFQSALLLLAGMALMDEQRWGGFLAVAACGLQNAMTKFYSESAIRSTHLTGFFTDLGLLLGQRSRGAPLPWRRLLLGGLVMAAFVGGGVFTALTFNQWGFRVLSVPALLVASIAVGLAIQLAKSGAQKLPQ
ncbi:DUF1275 domain-containing protein [Xanthomonas campestris]|uniref:YoaK family protein n=1 Tax=Xanthomonas campestris TaxID=339 RepID=UPI000E772241|nr:YoaK family protein [Xanthomonas campestris]RJU11200.1 DUF1275 domain-containing protein [Xanthomonas campestris]